MVDSHKIKNTGLRGVIIADTKISHSDGEEGILIYRGYRTEELAAHVTFEEMAYLLLYSDLPTKQQLREFKSKLVQERDIPSFLYDCLKRFPKRPARWMCFRQPSRFSGWQIPNKIWKRVRPIWSRLFGLLRVFP